MRARDTAADAVSTSLVIILVLLAGIGAILAEVAARASGAM